MALSPDPFTYAHPLSHTWHNIQYGKRDDQILHYYQNTTRITGGNPLFMIWHGGSREANEALSFVEGSAFGHYFLGYLLDVASYGTSACFDVISAEYSCHSHDRIPSNAYVERLTYVGGGSCLVKSFPTYNEQTIEDVQAANQWARANATARGFHADKIIGFGHSMGGNALGVAAYTPSRAWDAQSTAPFAARAESIFSGILLWEAEMDLSPWMMANRHTKTVEGFIEADATINGVRGDLERKYLLPDPTTGLYTSGVEKSAACKAMSPVDVIRRYGPYRPLPVRSYYVMNFGAVGAPPPPYGDVAETRVPVTDYVTIPPYDAAGHDWRQRELLDDACAAVGIVHTGSVVNGADFPIIPSPGPLYSPDLKLALEGTLPSTYEWAVNTINGVT